jgi:hypothetical protein
MKKLMMGAIALATFVTTVPAKALDQTDLENIALVLLYDRDCLVFRDDTRLSDGAKAMLNDMAGLFSEAERLAAAKEITRKFTVGRQRHEFCYAGQRMQLDQHIQAMNSAGGWRAK